jgi:anti-sigma B factor antagonist
LSSIGVQPRYIGSSKQAAGVVARRREGQTHEVVGARGTVAPRATPADFDRIWQSAIGGSVPVRQFQSSPTTDRRCAGFPDDFAIAESVRGDGKVVLAVTGEIDIATAGEFKAALDGLAARKRPTVVDLRSVRHMDSTGLAILLRADRCHDGEHWSFAIASELSDAVRRLFEITGVRGFLPFDSTPTAPSQNGQRA